MDPHVQARTEDTSQEDSKWPACQNMWFSLQGFPPLHSSFSTLQKVCTLHVLQGIQGGLIPSSHQKHVVYFSLQDCLEQHGIPPCSGKALKNEASGGARRHQWSKCYKLQDGILLKQNGEAIKANNSCWDPWKDSFSSASYIKIVPPEHKYVAFVKNSISETRWLEMTGTAAGGHRHTLEGGPHLVVMEWSSLSILSHPQDAEMSRQSRKRHRQPGESFLLSRHRQGTNREYLVSPPSLSFCSD